MSTRAREIADRVEFRWRQHEEEFAQRLSEAAEDAGRSQPDYARELLKKALTASDLLQQAVESLQQDVADLHHRLRELVTIKDGVRAVHENIYQFRDDLAACVIKLLADAGRIDPKTAENWVRKALDGE